MNKSFLLLAIVSLLMIVNQSLTAQGEIVAEKLFYGELCGPGVVMSVNLDGRFKSNERLGFGYRIGVGYGFEGFEDKLVELLFTERDIANFHKGVMRTFYSVPAGLNYVFGNPKKAFTFEVGTGVTLLTRKTSLYNWKVERAGNIIGFFNFMYRIMPVNGGMSFRVGFTPIIGTAGDLFPMGSIGWGYAF